MKVSELIRELTEEYRPDEEVCSIIWDREDIYLRRRHLKLPVETYTEEEAAQLLSSLERGHDANEGITWTTLDDATLKQEEGITFTVVFGEAPPTKNNP